MGNIGSIDIITKKIKQSAAEIEKLQKDNSLLRDQNNQLNQKITAMDDSQIEKIKAENLALKKELDEKLATIDKLKKEVNKPAPTPISTPSSSAEINTLSIPSVDNQLDSEVNIDKKSKKKKKKKKDKKKKKNKSSND